MHKTTADTTLDPDDWDSFRRAAHDMLDRSLDHMQTVRDGRVWTPLPEAMKAALTAPLPRTGVGADALTDQLAALLPYGVGNTHPRFFGWVHGAGNPGGVLADMAAAAINANLGGRDHGGIYVERQVIDWARQMMGLPDRASGLITSGTSMGTIVALKVARDRTLGFDNRRTGNGNGTDPGAVRLVGYTSDQSHACIKQAFDMLGLGADALRLIPVDGDFRMNTKALQAEIRADIAAGNTPFCVIGTAGSVNVGAVDDLDAIADIAAANGLWFHVDGAFGATGILSDLVRPLLTGMDRADSIAFDFHKWLQLNYAAGCVLIRDADAHLRSFADRPEYLHGAQRGLAAGAPWPTDLGPELSRGYLALKIWAHLLEHGTQKLGQIISMNCQQAQVLRQLTLDHPKLTLGAPVAMNIVCLRYDGDDRLNHEIVLQLQEQGLAVPSTTRLNGQLWIRVNITNHRTRDADMAYLIRQITDIGARLSPP